MKRRKIGLIVMAYGTPYTTSDIKRYYTHIRQGREPSEEALKELTEKYEAIGGVSPMANITINQAESLASKLNKIQDTYEFKLYIGLRHIEPFIEEAVQSMAKDGIKEAISIILTPHYSEYSIKGYNVRAQEEASKYGIMLNSIEYWYDEPQFIKYWTNEINLISQKMTKNEQQNAVLIFTAHSLPKKLVGKNDPYIEQLADTAKLIVENTIIKDYHIGWQSAGNTSDPWLEPEVLSLTKSLYNERGYRTFIYCPVGFVSDHLEIFYDNDYECKEVCEGLGATYYRLEMPNNDPLFIEGLASALLKGLQI